MPLLPFSLDAVSSSSTLLPVYFAAFLLLILAALPTRSTGNGL